MGGGGDGENEKRMVFLLTLSIGCTFLPMAMFIAPSWNSQVQSSLARAVWSVLKYLYSGFVSINKYEL